MAIRVVVDRALRGFQNVIEFAFMIFPAGGALYETGTIAGS